MDGSNGSSTFDATTQRRTTTNDKFGLTGLSPASSPSSVVVAGVASSFLPSTKPLLSFSSTVSASAAAVPRSTGFPSPLPSTTVTYNETVCDNNIINNNNGCNACQARHEGVGVVTMGWYCCGGRCSGRQATEARSQRAELISR